MSAVAEVHLWGLHIATVAEINGRIAFEYTRRAVDQGIEVAPLTLPLSTDVYADSFARLNVATFKGLPGLLADSLPDRFGQDLIGQWLASQGRSMNDFSAIEQLCYTGNRGMGALEYRPALDRHDLIAEALEVEQLVALANDALSAKGQLSTSGLGGEDLNRILSVGTSAGGARAKAVIAWNRDSGEVRSGQLTDLPAGFEHWLLKFDGVDKSGDRGLSDPNGWGRVEYAYYLMALAAGVEMTECRLLEEGGRAHFMTRRFDRPDDGTKVHTQTLCAIGHWDYNQPRSASYEIALSTLRELACPRPDFAQMVHRCVFNLLARNQDDHTKNMTIMMNSEGDWALSPAYDVTYAVEPGNRWLHSHQMTVNGKAGEFVRADIWELGRVADMKPREVDEIIGQVQAAAARWPEFAAEAAVLDVHRDLHIQFLTL